MVTFETSKKAVPMPLTSIPRGLPFRGVIRGHAGVFVVGFANMQTFLLCLSDPDPFHWYSLMEGEVEGYRPVDIVIREV